MLALPSRLPARCFAFKALRRRNIQTVRSAFARLRAGRQCRHHLARARGRTFQIGRLEHRQRGEGRRRRYLASDAVAKADADGYSLVLFTTGHVISPALNKQLGFLDPVEDFSFVTTVTEFPFFIVVGADSRFKSIVDDPVKEARAKSGSLTVRPGVGTGQHMCSELFAVSLAANSSTSCSAAMPAR